MSRTKGELSASKIDSCDMCAEKGLLQILCYVQNAESGPVNDALNERRVTLALAERLV